jgi:hypothetical protein
MKTPTLHFSLPVLLTLAITACSTTTQLPKNVLRETILNNHVAVAPIAKPAQLSERTKAQAIGNFVVSSVVGSLAGSAGDAKNLQQLQSNAEIGRAFSQELSKALPDSYAVGAGKGADLALAKKIDDYLSNLAPSSAPSQRELSIAVNTSLWELGYVSFLTSQDYALNYGLQVIFLEQKDGKQRPIKTISCGSSAKEKMPLENWKAENYKAVDASAEIIVNACFSQFLAETGLD